ncbi:hypothetical protein AAEO56_12495 [Flavobacterium sp. DGU11]|uniref:Tetratricopeptide repeat-containing protein n=1 Tax=Flavobacterium arundinis TaxID=3139143 RepID=A0ABU9HY38_9FLAO
MKNFPVFILLLLSSFSQSVNACWYYPEGDEVRYCFFNSFTGDYPQYSMFNYTSSAFADSPPSNYRSLAGDDPNIMLWVKYCNNKVSAESAEEAVYGLGAININKNSQNPMLRYLYGIKDFEALEYLKFAKTVEGFNEYYENPWERDEDIVFPKRQGKISLALNRAKQVKNTAIRSRYYFLAIRMAFYNRDHVTSKKIYDDYFEGKKHNDIIDYWSLYFHIAGEKDTALQSYYAAMVFANAPDKRFQVFYYFNKELPIAKVLKYAKNKKEIAAIYTMYAIRKTDYALEGLRGIYKYDTSSDALGFLLMREMNKLEDWIYTPYYSYFSPMLYADYENQQTTKLLMERVADDREYAAKVLQFINSVDLNKVQNPQVFKAAKAYLLFMVKDYNACLAFIGTLKKEAANDKGFAHQLLLIKSLCLTANQAKGSAVIPETVKAILMGELSSTNAKFVFAIGRELEYLGNTTDAALLYSRMRGYDVNWKAKDQHSPYYDDYYNYYFEYLDGVYSTSAVKALITDLKGKRSTDDFSQWLYKDMDDLNGLYELLGTKYIRINKLKDALAAFDKMAPDSRTSGYLDNNPFYQIKYTPDFTERRDSIQLTKADITKHLIQYIAKGADPKEKDRDYYNFLAANCYYNMTQNGNTWYMRRYTWSSSELTSGLPDEEEFHDCNYAKYYYIQAYKSAKTKKFKALCLRYAANCERMKLMYRYNNETTEEHTDINKLLYSNIYYKKLKKKYPSYCKDFDDSSCMHFSEYFKARR